MPSPGGDGHYALGETDAGCFERVYTGYRQRVGWEGEACRPGCAQPVRKRCRALRWAVGNRPESCASVGAAGVGAQLQRSRECEPSL